ncbi:hypothetical protein SAMN05519104_0046 [Rhizobiales bacterium GAS188]|nr:hypothetical protein SAMN05519104_0046 [Rhizobiales bacterium GAS188]
MFALNRFSRPRLAFAGATLLAAITLVPALASAQQVSAECKPGIELFKARITWIQRIQALPKKHTDPIIACTLFGNLSSANARVLAWAKSNKDWCAIEDNQITGLEAEAKQVGSIRAKACNVAAEFGKLKHQAEQAAKNRQSDSFSVDMHSDPLASPVKIPPSAL